MTSPATATGPGPYDRQGPTLDAVRDPEGDSSEALADRLAGAMADAWRRGEPVRTEDVLAGHPSLGRHPTAAIRLIYEEICLREERGEAPSPAEWVARFPRWRSELEALLNCHRALDGWAAPPRWPEPGQILGGYRLEALLGRGARGRVYLAIQPHLADRPTVLKVTPRDGAEHLTLARLLHSHIVPLYTVEDFPGRNLRGLCMPYLGGMTLAQLLDRWREGGPAIRDGGAFVAALDDAGASAPVPSPTARLARDALARRPYVEVVCEIGACLADALHHAHERGLVHLDLKPSNVLISEDGVPMLLDFHLAQSPIRAGGAAPAWLGGTPDYMAPEHCAAFAAVQARATIPSDVDGRADLYGLGMILYEMLGGAIPRGSPAPPPRLDRGAPGVSVGLADILQKCLARDPRDRYPDSSALAGDLRRHLADLPLRGVGNRSLRERWRKWRRRRPHAIGMLLILVSLTAALGLAGAGAIVHGLRRSTEAREALETGREQLVRHQYADAIRTLKRGIACAAGPFGDSGLARTLRSEWRRAERAGAADRLRVVADQVRFIHGAQARAPEELRALESSCRAIWEARGRIVADERTGADLIAIAMLRADVGVRLAEPDRVADAHRAALAWFDELEVRAGPGPILDRERLAHAEALGLAERAAALRRHAAGLVPRTAREHEAMGESLVRSGDFAPALEAFGRALDAEPQAFWPRFGTGVCAYHLHRYRDALAAFDVCVALAPDSAPCYYNRALALVALGEADRAARDFERALRHDPAHAESARELQRLRDPSRLPASDGRD